MGPGVVQRHLGQVAGHTLMLEAGFGLGMEEDDPVRLSPVGDESGQDAPAVGLVAVTGGRLR